MTDEPTCPKCREIPPLVHRVSRIVWAKVEQWACDACGHGWTVHIQG